VQALHGGRIKQKGQAYIIVMNGNKQYSDPWLRNGNILHPNNWNPFSSIDLNMRFRTSWSERLSFQRATLSYLSATIDILLMTMTCRFIIGEGQGQVKI